MDDQRLRRIAEIEIALSIVSEHVREAEQGMRPFPAPVPTGGFEIAEARVHMIHRHLVVLLHSLDQTYGVHAKNEHESAS